MFWWQAEGEELGLLLQQTLKQLEQDHTGRVEANKDMLRLYTSRDYESLDRLDPSLRQMPRGDDMRIRLNVAQNMVDTIVSRVGKSRPKPMYLTRRGDYNLRTRALRLTDIMEGIFHQTKLYEVMPRIFRDAAIFDIAALKVGREGDGLFVERVWPNELRWDLNAAYLADQPPAMHQVKRVPLETMVLTFPEFETEIRADSEQGSNPNPSMGDHAQDTNMVQCCESWHLPSITGADDGRHVISMGTLILSDDPWKYGRYPFVFLKWGDAGVGFAGQSLVEQLRPIQMEINKLALRIQQAMHLLAVPWIYVQAGSRVVDSHLRNQPGTIINYVGEPPISYTPTSMHPEVYSHLDRLYQRAYEIAGISELSATGKKPAGLESGAALRTYHDIETERFVNIAQRYEQSFMDAAAWIKDLAQEIVEDSGSFPVKGIKNNALREMDFKQINMAESDYILQAYPTSLLPSTPAGRLAAVTELIQSGIITQRDHIVRLLDFPDLQSVTSLYDTLDRDMEWRVSEILETETYHAPEPYMDLMFAKERMTIAYLEGQQDGLEGTKLEMMTQFIDTCSAMIQTAQQQPPGGAPEAPPPGPAMPPLPPGMPPLPPGMPPLPPGMPPLGGGPGGPPELPAPSPGMDEIATMEGLPA